MSTQLYEKLFLVNNIPKIEGILQVRDMIKGYAYIGDMYMNLARNFSIKFKLVNIAIRQAYSNNNPKKCQCCRESIESNIHGEVWFFAYDRYKRGTNKNCEIGYEIINGELIYHIEELRLEAKNCYICGEYIYNSTSSSNLPFCSCDRDS